MDEHSKQIYFTRQRLEAHSHSILNDRQDRDQAKETLSRVFSHISAVYGDPSKRDFVRTSINDQRVSSQIGKAFYCSGAYVLPEIIKGELGAKLEIRTLINLLLQKNPTTDNVFSFMSGDIGQGKTAFVNYMITAHGEEIVKKGFFFCRFNVDTCNASQDAGHFSATFMKLFTKKLSEVFRKVGERGYLDFDTSKAATRLLQGDADPALVASQIIQFSQTTGLRPLIILDNVDYLVHRDIRQTFLHDQERHDRSYLALIRDLMSVFKDTHSPLAKIGATILMVVRQDTYRIIQSQSTMRGFRSDWDMDQHWYVLKSSNLLEILTKRLEFLRLVAELEGLPNGAIKQLRSYENWMQARIINEKPRLGLLEMSSEGLRGVFHYARSLLFYYGVDHGFALIKRQTDLLIIFMSKAHALFSQTECGFPNIYFSNILPDEESFQVVHRGTIRNVSQDHRHTYWLKRVVLALVRQLNNDELKCDLATLHSILGGDGYNGYTLEQIGLCLGSFIEQPMSMITTSREPSNEGTTLRLSGIKTTTRTNYILDNVVDTFGYLQLVIDDFNLPIPRMLLKQFRAESHYSYLVALDSEIYANGSRQMIARKGILVARFLALLKVSLDFERQASPGVFRKLADLGVILPDIDEVFSQVRRDIVTKASIVRTNESVPTHDDFVNFCTEARAIIQHDFQRNVT